MDVSASIREFLSRRTRQPSSAFDFVMAPILHREYLKWVRTSRRISTTLEEVVDRTVHKNEPKLSVFVGLMQALGYEPKTVQRPGLDLQCFDLLLLDEAEREKVVAHARERAAPVVLERVRLRETLEFVDGVVVAGTVVDLMRPGELEQVDMAASYKRDVVQLRELARPWVVLRCAGRRRLLQASVIERVAARSTSA